MRISQVVVAVTATVATVALTACGSSSNSPSGSAGGLVKNGTFTFAVSDDPGNLDPLASSQTTAVNLFRFLYDPLVHADASGKIVSGLAQSWQVNGKVATFKIKQGVTCSDGSPLTASTVAEAFNNLKNPKLASSLVGIALPNADYTVKADNASSTFTLTLSQPYHFLLQALEFLPIPCGPAAADPESLAETASGSGPYTLKSAVPNDQYTLVRRNGYTWGPGGATTAALGLPKTIIMRIISSESTAANLLVTGQLNAAVVNGPDRERLTGQAMSQKADVSGGNVMLFNEGKGRITSDPKVRTAIVEALNFNEIAKVVTEGLDDQPSHSLAPAEPQACTDAAAASAVPKTNVANAKSLLESDGWKVGSGGIRTKDGKQLVLNAPYLSTYAGNLPALELINQQLSAIGAKLNLMPLTEATLSTTLFDTGNFDIWPVLALSVPFQSGLYGILAGPPPPDGINAARIANSTFTQTGAEGNTTNGAAGCQLWTKAEKALFSNADVEPVAPVMTNWVTNKATFQTMQGRIIPTSIRLTS